MKVIKIIILNLLCLYAFIQVSVAQELPKPNAAQAAWQQAELGVIFHYDLHVFDGKPYNQTLNRYTPIRDIHIFNPSQLDVEQWVISAKEAGAKFALITATHETGFALYPSKANPYNTRSLGWTNGKEDIVGDFIQACRKHDIEPGVYLGIRWNSYLGVHDFKVNGEGKMQQERQHYYNNMVEEMVKEICTWYGPLFKIWFDGGASHPDKGAPDVLPIVKEYQPNCLFYHNDQLAEARWGGSESGTVSYPCWSTFPYHYTGSGESAPAAIGKNGYQLLKTGDPDGKYYMPAMSDAPLRGANGRHEWFWEPNDEHAIYPLQDLVDMYYKSVGRNSTLLLGVTPDTAGLVPPLDRQRLQEFGDKIKNMFGQPLTDQNSEVMSISLKNKQETNCFILQEELHTGQRVLSFTIQAKTPQGWKDIYSGSSIGHKHIAPLDHPIKAKEFRLIIDKSKDNPSITTFTAHNTNYHD